MTDSNEGLVQVTQADKDAWAELEHIIEVGYDKHGGADTPEAFLARHRSDNTDELVVLLRRARLILGPQSLLHDDIEAALAKHKGRQP